MIPTRQLVQKGLIFHFIYLFTLIRHFTKLQKWFKKTLSLFFTISILCIISAFRNGCRPRFRRLFRRKSRGHNGWTPENHKTQAPETLALLWRSERQRGKKEREEGEIKIPHFSRKTIILAPFCSFPKKAHYNKRKIWGYLRKKFEKTWFHCNCTKWER